MKPLNKHYVWHRCCSTFTFYTLVCRREYNNMCMNHEIKYQIPRLEIAALIDDKIILKLKQADIDQKYKTSYIEKSSI